MQRNNNIAGIVFGNSLCSILSYSTFFTHFHFRFFTLVFHSVASVFPPHQLIPQGIVIIMPG